MRERYFSNLGEALRAGARMPFGAYAIDVSQGESDSGTSTGVIESDMPFGPDISDAPAPQATQVTITTPLQVDDSATPSPAAPTSSPSAVPTSGPSTIFGGVNLTAIVLTGLAVIIFLGMMKSSKPKG